MVESKFHSMTDFNGGGAQVPLLSPVESAELQQVIRNSTGGDAAGAEEEQGCCPLCCAVFSAVAVVVLTLLGAYTLTGSRFISYETGSGMSRTGQAIQIFVAAGFYALTCGISLYTVVGFGAAIWSEGGGGVRSIGHVLRARRTGTGCGSSAGRDFVDTFAAVCIAENYFAFTVLRSPLLLCCSARCCSPLSCPALLCSSTRQPRRTRLTWTPSRPTPQYSRSQPASNAAANEAVARRNLSNSLGNGNSGLML